MTALMEADDSALQSVHDHFQQQKNRKEISRKAAETLASKYEKCNCIQCGRELARRNRKTCSTACLRKFRSERCKELNHIHRDENSKRRIAALMKGDNTGCGHKCMYTFKGSDIRCDLKLEYACLEFMTKHFDVLTITRCDITIPYVFNGNKHNYIPDFIVRTSEQDIIIECKYNRAGKYLNKKWGSYIERAKNKKKALVQYAQENMLEWLWFTNETWPKGYSALFGKDMTTL
jgi:hypothetical protein